MRLCLVEDRGVAGLEPLTLTRAASELLLGSSSLGAKTARAFGVGPGPARRALCVRPHVAAIQRERDPHTVVNDRDWLARGPVLVANGRWVPPFDFTPPDDGGAWLGLCDGQPACALVGPEIAASLNVNGVEDWFEEVATRPDIEVFELGGDWINRPWDLVARNAEHIARDFLVDGRVGVSNRHLTTMALVGPADRLFIHETARDRSVHGLRHHQRPDHARSRRLGPAVHADRGSVLHRPRHPALPRQPPRRR